MNPNFQLETFHKSRQNGGATTEVDSSIIMNHDSLYYTTRSLKSGATVLVQSFPTTQPPDGSDRNYRQTGAQSWGFTAGYLTES
jgi:hypothetical protein